MRRQIENVIFHDPRRHDQDRFRPDLFGRRSILDQLDQAIAIDHLAGRYRDIAADLKLLGAGRLLAAQGALAICKKILRAAHQIESTGAYCAPQDFRIGQQEIRWRGHVKQLPRGEFHHVFVMFRHPAQAGRGIVPPLLLQQKILIDEVEGPVAPLFIGKAVILRQRLDAHFRARAFGRTAERIVGETHRLADCLIGKLHAFARCGGEMRRPIPISLSKRGRRQSSGHACKCSMQRAVGDVSQRSDAVGVTLTRLDRGTKSPGRHPRLIGCFRRYSRDFGRYHRVIRHRHRPRNPCRHSHGSSSTWLQGCDVSRRAVIALKKAPAKSGRGRVLASASPGRGEPGRNTSREKLPTWTEAALICIKSERFNERGGYPCPWLHLPPTEWQSQTSAQPKQDDRGALSRRQHSRPQR